jgi:hypothetical protein
MLYSYETWGLTEKSKRTLETTKMNTIWRSMRISRRERSGMKKSNNR